MNKTLQSSRGFTLVEVLVVLIMIGIIAGIAAPSMSEWLTNARYREAVSSLGAALKNTRSRTIATNLEHRLEIDLTGDRYRMTQGNRPYNSTASSFAANVVIDWTGTSPLVNLKGNNDCSVETGTVTIGFNPNGTGESQYICITDEAGNKKYRAGVENATTGRVVAQKYSPGSNSWH